MFKLSLLLMLLVVLAKGKHFALEFITIRSNTLL